MPLKTIRQLDEVIKTTTVVYDHSNAKLVSKKNKVRRCGKDAFLSSHPYSTFSCHRSAENKLLASSTTQPKFKHTNRRATKSTKQKLQFCVQAHLPLVPKTLSFELDPETPISTLKGLISKKFGVKPRHQRLYIRRDIWLCDLLTLHDNGIDKDDIISLSTHDAAQNGSKENTTVDEEYVCLLSSKIGSSWRKLAKHLGYEDAEIAEIQANIRVTSEASRQMLLTWRKKIRDRDEAFQKLRQALTTVGLTDLAQNVPDSCQSRDKVAGSQSEQHKDTKAAEQNKPKGATTSEAQTQLKGKDLKTDGPQALQYVKQKLQIFIGNPLLRGPRTFCFQLDPEASISSLKKLIHRKIGVLPQHQCLYIIRNCRNFQLCDLLTLSDCGIQQDENVLFRLSTDGLRGGGPKGDDQLLRDLSSKVQEFWIELAKILGIEESEIKNFQDLIESDKERSHQMLLSWWSRQGNREAGLEKLRESLISIGLFEQALLIPGNRQDAISQTKMQPKQAGEDDSLTAVGSDDLKDDGGNVSGSNFGTQSLGDAGDGTGPSAGLITGASGVVSRSVIDSKSDGDAGDTGVATAQLVGQITQAPGDALRGEVSTQPSYTSTKLSTSAIPAFKLSEQIMLELAEELGPQWEKLAIQLGFTSGVIEGFKSDNQTTVVMQGYKMLVAWMQKQDDDTEQQIKRLCAALTKAGRVDLTKTLQVFPGMQIETDLLKNGMKSRTMTLLFRELVKDLLSTCGESYVMHEFFAALKLWDLELEDVTYKSVVFVIRIKTRVGLEKLWAMYTTGELAKKLTEIFVTDDLTTEDKSDLSIQVTIPEKDYEQCCRFFEELDNATHEGNEQDASCKTTMQPKQFREDNSITTAGSDGHTEQATGRSAEKTNASHRTADNRQIDDQFLTDSSSNEVQKYRKECTDYRENEETAIKRFQTLSQGNKERSSQIPTLQCGKQTNRKEGIQKRREPLESNGLTEQAPDNAQTDDQFLPDLSYSEAHECRKQFTEYKGYEEPETKQFQTLSEKNKEHCFRTLIWWWKKHVEGLQGLIKALESIGIPGQAFLTLGHEQDINSGTEEQPKLLGQTSTEATAYNYDRAELCC
ncbi:uncharacterized protein LOC110987487 isoform X2 [Acanthaster planci]|uniref:Uncharacterized protein LOC110987487 isoform X2 n=1 Tax=Acanthaster planci TaxID=133434 RepID=A0A8B7ZLL1_ACAPL|nr:uncharacterized protein LOC110987487 isoform X2 [Acanthaster planci]